MKMKNLIFCVAMNFISAIVLIGAGAMEMNNLVTSVPAILCIIAGICGIIGIKKNNVKAKLFCPEIAGLFCRIAGLFCHDSRANLSLKPVCFGIAIS